MCDYSLMHLPNRLAVEGEELMVYRFPSGSMGLASPNDRSPRTETPIEISWQSLWKAVKKFLSPEECSIPAVCIAPGTRLVLHQIPDRMQCEYGLGKEEECTFDQLSSSPYSYRDAVRFRNGRFVRIQELSEGQPVTVLGHGAVSEDPVSADGSSEQLDPAMV